MSLTSAHLFWGVGTLKAAVGPDIYLDGVSLIDLDKLTMCKSKAHILLLSIRLG